MMKKQYVKPSLELICYSPGSSILEASKGYAIDNHRGDRNKIIEVEEQTDEDDYWFVEID